jgi:hypothetical protein
LLLGAAWAVDSREFTTDFRIEDCTFSDTDRNPYFSLNPGDVFNATFDGRLHGSLTPGP